MSTPSKRKGSKYERDCVEFLREYGWPDAERAYGAGRKDDVGDIDGIVGCCIECKAEKSIDLPGYLRELEREMAAKKVEMGVVLVKRRGAANAAESYAVMPAWLWADLMKQAGY